jgi:hypothetical protein
MDKESSEPGVAPSRRHVGGAGRRADIIAGSCLGLLLGISMGLSTSPVIGVVVTGLVAILGAFFGLAEKDDRPFSAAAARRLTAFALVASLSALGSVWLRTHGTLGPTVQEHRKMLAEMHVPDDQQAALLVQLHWGLVMSAPAKDESRPDHADSSKAERETRVAVATGPTFSGFFEDRSSLCGEYARLKAQGAAAADYRLLFDSNAKAYRSVAALSQAFAELPENKRQQAYESAYDTLCRQPS